MLRGRESSFAHLAAIILYRLPYIAAQIGILFYEPRVNVLEEAE